MTTLVLTLKPYLGSLKTPEDRNESYFLIGWMYFKVLKPVWTLGSLKAPNTVNVGILGYGSKVKDSPYTC